MDDSLWTYPETVGRLDLTGFEVEAADGSIGKVDEWTNQAAGSYLVIDTGVWIFGTKVILPAGLVERVDRDQETVYIAPTKDEVKDAPEFVDDDASEDYRSALSDYYRGRQSAVHDIDATSHRSERFRP
jgi:hypothetical protein